MITYTKFLTLCFCCGFMVLSTCTRENPIHTSDGGPLEIRPVCKLARSLTIDEIASADALVSGKGIDGTLTFELLVNLSARNLYGTLKLPEGATSCDVVIRIYDSQERKIGEGSYSLTKSHFDAGRCVTPEIGIASAKPWIDTIYSHESSVGINDSIALHAAASDSFGGTIEKYEWKFGNGPWIETGTGDTTVTAPATAQAYVCSLRVTDDDGNVTYAAITVTVETRAPTANAGTDTTVGINDVVNLRGSGSSDETGITEYAWKCGSGDWLVDGDGDTSVVAPATAQAWVCSLRVTDDDGNSTYAAITVTVETRAPVVVAAGDTAVFVNEQVHLYGSGSYDETEIVVFAWKIGGGSWASVSTGDTTITTPGTEQTLVCSLRVTDNDGNIVFGEVAVVTVATSIVDADGNTYTVIKIGDQFWTVENLRTTKYNDETLIPHVTDGTEWGNLSTPGYCWYDNSTVTTEQEKWGALYNWYAVNTGNLAPAGWHVPTDAEWTQLEEYLIANGYNWDGTTSGNKIGKSLAAKTDWSSTGTAGDVGNDLTSNNSTGFSALPGGFRYDDGIFYYQSINGYWWSATEFDASGADYRDLSYRGETLYRSGYNKKCGFSVRLVRDSN